MTIYVYTSGKDEKPKDGELVESEVSVTEPLSTSYIKEDCEPVASPKLIQVTYFPRNRRTCCVHFMLSLMVLVILTCGAIGAVVFYKNINKRTYSGVCGVSYYDDQYSELRGYDATADASMMDQTDDVPMAYVREEIEVNPVEEWEYLHTPGFDEVRETAVWHDFQFNYTAIVDHQLRRCNIMSLNRTAVAWPANLMDLVELLLNGYHYSSARVIRQNYRTMAAIDDLAPFGRTIRSRCLLYDSFWIERVSRVSKRSAEPVHRRAYGMLSNHRGQQEIYKIFISEAN